MVAACTRQIIKPFIAPLLKSKSIMSIGCWRAVEFEGEKRGVEAENIMLDLHTPHHTKIFMKKTPTNTKR